MINVIGYSEYKIPENRGNPLRYKTDVFQITSGTSISEIYDYFRANPTISIMVNRSEPRVWGDPDNLTDGVGYTQIISTWEYTTVPNHPIVLKWNMYSCDGAGMNTSFIGDLLTPLNNLAHYDG